MEENYIVYVKTDLENKIVSINSSAFISDTTDWAQIDEGLGDKYHHAQGHYLEKGLMNENGCFNYKLVNGVVAERTIAEKQVEINLRPYIPTAEEEIQALRQSVAELTFLISMGGM